MWQFKFIIFIFIFLVSACHRLEEINQPPEMSPSFNANHALERPQLIGHQTPIKPQQIAHNQIQTNYNKEKSSLWQSGPSSLFGDRRAKQIGDILTVDIVIDDRAQVNNRTQRQRTSDNESQISAALGVDKAVGKFLPSPLSLSPGVSTTGAANTLGNGQIDRRERINLKMAAIVTNILPNGNMVIQGSQEVRVNYELRDLQVTGLIRPEDISRRNTINYDKIAEARISYGGRGQVSSLQQPRYGDQFFDIISPF
jgi:flagellar L-ring protein precursor FlgH